MSSFARKVAVRFLSFAVLTCGIFSTAFVASAQDKNLHAGEGQGTLPYPRWDKDDKELKAFQAYRDSGSAVSPETLDQAAQWYAYRFTHDTFQTPAKPGAKGMHDLLKDALLQVIDPKDPNKKVSEAQLRFMEDFDKPFIKHLHLVVKNPKPIVRVNAAMVLAKLAATGQEDAVMVLLEVIKDPKENDGIKLHAFKGVKDFLALGRGDNANPFRKKDREAQCILTLLEYLARKPDISDTAPAEEQAALHYVRREAIAALGETRYPGILKSENKKTLIERPTALTLVQIMRKEGVTPPPTVEEQVNAAVGVCRLRSRTLDQYHVDYAAQQIGWFVVDFITAHNNSAPQSKSVPWKVLAARLSRALEEFKADAEGRQEAKYVTAVVNQADPLLKTLIESKGKPSPETFVGWLEQNKPAKEALYDGTVVAVAGAPQATAE
jgi:hypothetical protein